MTGPVVRTVLGDVDPGALGPCDAHEHLFLETPLQPGEDFTEVGKAIEEVRALAAAGAGSLVDWTPVGLGRSAEGLVAVSEATGVHVVAATGLHRDAHYTADDPLRALDSGAMAERFVAEIRDGIEDTGVRAGIVKAGASYHHVSPFEEKVFAAAAAAHLETGAPVCVHTQHGTMGLGLVERLVALGVPADRIVLAHLDRNPDAGEHAETAATGAWLQFDGPGRAKYHPDSTILALIADLAERGHADRMLVGGDTGRRSMLRAYGGGPGLDYVFARFRPRLRRELGADLDERLFVANPQRAFALVEPS